MTDNVFSGLQDFCFGFGIKSSHFLWTHPLLGATKGPRAAWQGKLLRNYPQSHWWQVCVSVLRRQRQTHVELTALLRIQLCNGRMHNIRRRRKNPSKHIDSETEELAVARVQKTIVVERCLFGIMTLTGLIF